MKDYNKENLKRLLAMFAAVLIFFSALADLVGSYVEIVTP